MIYIICGPTGSGKTDIAIELANYFSCPIINADAFQIYKEMDIGTAKISKDDINYKRHYLIDILTPEENYSVKQYQIDFRNTLKEIDSRYNDCIICGGTGLYIKAALYDYNFEEQEEDDTSDLLLLSNEELWQKLNELDPEACNSIHINNRKRVIRAISIARSNKTTKSINIAMQKHKMIFDESSIKILMINPDREVLYKNINNRVDVMFERGLVKEVKYLLEKYNLSQTAKAAIGYKEVIDYFNGNLSLYECKNLIKQRSRNYAKRQVTFFKNQFPSIQMFSNKEELLKVVYGK